MAFNIRQSVNNNARSLVDGGVAGLVTLAAGGNKAQAAMAAVGQAVATKVLGPLGLVAGLAFGATKGLISMTKAWGQMGTAGAAAMETVQNQLRVLLKGLDAAKQRVRTLRDFSVASPFKLRDIVQGDRALQSLTKGALTTREAMILIGDAAAQADTDFASMSGTIGKLYDELQSGRPVGEVLFRLNSLGVISGEARNQIEALQASGAGFNEVWRVVEGQLKRSAGTMGFTSKTLIGLQSTLDDTEDQLKSTFSGHFIEGQKAAIEANIQTLNNLLPAVNGVGRAFGGLVTVTSVWGAKLTAMVTSIPGVSAAMEFLARMSFLVAGGLSTVIVAVGGSRLIALLGRLAVSTGALAGAMKALRLVLLSIISPMGLVLAALAVAGTAWMMYRDRLAQAAEAVKEYNGATDAQTSKMEAQIRMIKTLDALAQAYTATLAQLAEAYRDESTARSEGRDAGPAKARIEAQKKLLARLGGIDRKGLQATPDIVDAGATRLAQIRGIEQQQRDAQREMMSPNDRVASLEDEANRLRDRRGAAAGSYKTQGSFMTQKAELGALLDENKAKQVQQQQLADDTLRSQRNLRKAGNPEGAAIAWEVSRQASMAVAALKEEEAALMRQEVELSQASADRIVQLQGGLSIVGRYESATEALVEAKRKLAEIENGPDSKTKAQEISDATVVFEQQKRTLEALTKAYEHLGWSARDAQAAAAELEVLKKTRAEDAVNSPEEVARAQEALRERRALAMTRGESDTDTRAKLAELNEGAAAGVLASVQAERERLELQRVYKQVDLEIYERKKRLLDREEAVLRAKQAEARGMTAAGGEADQMELMAKAARLRGKVGQARDLEEKAAQAKENAGLAARLRELKDEGFDEATAKRMAEQEISRARAGRAVDRLTSEMQSGLSVKPVTDGLQKIGGGGLVALQGPRDDLKKMNVNLERILKAIEVGNNKGPMRL